MEYFLHLTVCEISLGIHVSKEFAPESSSEEELCRGQIADELWKRNRYCAAMREGEVILPRISLDRQNGKYETMDAEEFQLRTQEPGQGCNIDHLSNI
ncbi:hypothetical protein NPIL_494571 [Nephila pilipes]|uniref:Uncharacterized protein n=1 Tax=Nephila pilipes TaxID=299642 RepID=A0A8X6NSQ8_NEPPI|nr:hypothetical protein NPIL_494571 [Nephila pilipes]